MEAKYGVGGEWGAWGEGFEKKRYGYEQTNGDTS
jgi:hypothetical protein